MKTLQTLIAILFLSTVVLAQEEPNELRIKGVTTFGDIYGAKEKLGDVSIKIYEGNKYLGTFYTDEKGKYDFTLPLNKYITLEFVKENFISKRFVYDTHTPVISEKYKVFEVQVVMIDKISGVDYEELDFPIAHVRYDAKKKDFDYVDKYTDKMLAKQDKVVDEILATDYLATSQE